MPRTVCGNSEDDAFFLSKTLHFILTTIIPLIAHNLYTVRTVVQSYTK